MFAFDRIHDVAVHARLVTLATHVLRFTRAVLGDRRRPADDGPLNDEFERAMVARELRRW